MTEILKWPARVATYALFFGGIGALSVWPSWKHADVRMSELKLSLSHAAQRVKPCIRLTPQEIADLPPNMRREEQCERERLPLSVELDIDGETVLRTEAAPSGVWNDGPASIYRRFRVSPGPHRIAVRMRDSADGAQWDYSLEDDVVLEAGRYFTITFVEETGGFRFR